MHCLCPAISKWITWVQPSRSSLASCRGQAVAVRRIRCTSRVDGWCEGSPAVIISCVSLHWSALFFDTGHYSRCPYSADIRYLCIIFQYSTFFSTPLGPTRVGTSLHQSSCFFFGGICRSNPPRSLIWDIALLSLLQNHPGVKIQVKTCSNWLTNNWCSCWDDWGNLNT